MAKGNIHHSSLVHPPLLPYPPCLRGPTQRKLEPSPEADPAGNGFRSWVTVVEIDKRKLKPSPEADPAGNDFRYWVTVVAVALPGACRLPKKSDLVFGPIPNVDD
jgi:hypothetical protein